MVKHFGGAFLQAWYFKGDISSDRNNTSYFDKTSTYTIKTKKNFNHLITVTNSNVYKLKNSIEEPDNSNRELMGLALFLPLLTLLPLCSPFLQFPSPRFCGYFRKIKCRLRFVQAFWLQNFKRAVIIIPWA